MANPRRITSTRRTRVCVVVAVLLIVGCGGGSDSGGGSSGGSDSSSGSAGDAQYIDPFRTGGACLSMREIRQKVDRIASQAQNPERKKKAIQVVRDRAC